ncbi:hypothetical protein [Naasia sp. SYSU D00057]|uniref:hypothetical protein n=1 Tax=Naasia sp. SYSU D00057 TaxID=2817380 RepID=UPI001B307C8C|nr:hypothetical protein [Naasia sp. SYSU D00057]
MKVADVYGIGVPVTSPAYVDRGRLDDAFARALETNRHISVHGGSKQGKSWLREKGLAIDDMLVVQATTTATAASVLEEALGALGITAQLTRTGTGALKGTLDLNANLDVGKVLARFKVGAKASGTASKEVQITEEFIGQSTGNLRWVATILAASGLRLVVEDFHYLKESEQEVFASWMKALGEYGLFVIIMGVWAQSHLLTYFNGDLEGRIEDFHLQWTEPELRQVLQNGEEPLNITFSQPLADALIADAYGNVGLLHRLVERLLIAEGIDDRREHVVLEVGESLTQARAEVADQMRGRFETFASNFVGGMRRMREGLVVYRHLLRAYTSLPDEQLLSRGVESREVLTAIGDSGIRASDLTQALERVDRLQVKIKIRPPVLTYHRAGKRVQLIDRSFLFFRKYGGATWPWDEPDEITNDLAGDQPLDFFDED